MAFRGVKRAIVLATVAACGFALGWAAIWMTARDDGAERPPGSDGPGATADPESPVVASQAPLPRRIDDPRLTESSGLARSVLHAGVLYTHNDRGGLPDVFAVDASGTRAVLRLDAPMVDWEDAATSSDGRLWIGDIGDNDLVRSEVSVLVLDEPDVLASASLVPRVYRLAYPDGPHDAEALLVHPESGRVLVVTKETDGGRMFAAPDELSREAVNRLEDVGAAPPNITAGDFAPDGKGYVLRNQGRAFFYSYIGSAPVVVNLPAQPQGESVTYTDDGRKILVGSEGPDSLILQVPVPEVEG